MSDGGFILPEVINPPRRCLTIMVPDDPNHLQAFWGALQELGYWFSWQRDPDKKGSQVSQVWTQVIQEAHNKFYSDNPCEVDMSCADVADCIENDDQTQAAVRALASSQATPGNQAVPGERLPDAVWTGNLADTSECDYDSFWSQCMRFTDYLVSAGNDLLEQIELYTNGLEAAGFVEAIPVLGTFIDELQADQFLEMLDWVIESVAEWYAAADTQPNRIDIACALFCANRDDCNLSLEETWTILNNRLGGIFDPSSLNSVEDLITAATTLMTSPSVPLDAWVLFVISMSRVMGYLGVKGVEKTLNIMLKIAADQPSDDWIELCEDCPAPSDCPPEGDFTTGQHGWTSATGSANYTVYHAGEGWGRGNVNFNRIGIRIPQDGPVSKIRVKWNQAVAGVMDLSTFNYSTKLYSQTTGIASDVWEIDCVGYSGGILIDTYPTFSGSDWPAELRLICVELL